MGKVIIGVDPHKRVHAIVVLDADETVLARRTFANSTTGYRELMSFARAWRQRTWAIEGSGGVGKHLAQRLVANGEHVLDVATRRSALVRVFAGGNGRKNDDLDAHSIALVGLHGVGLQEVKPDDRIEALRLLVQRRRELVSVRTQTVNRLHRDLLVLVPGGAPVKLTVTRAKQLLATVKPRDEVGKLRRRLAAEKIAELVVLDRQLAGTERELKDFVKRTPTNLMKLYGVGPVIAAIVLGEVGDVARFKSRHHFASYNASAPDDRDSAGHAHCVNLKGNRRLNHALHMVAVTQLRQANSEGRCYYDRKIAEGKTRKEAVRALKRRISDSIYRQLVADAQALERGPGGQAGTTPMTSVTGSTPTAGSSVKSQPGPHHNGTPAPAA